MIKVSIIIPVYNTEQYLKRCLDSVIGQTLADIEIICVNDGSTDGCPQILESYAARDDRIKVIHKENGGLVSARKTGVEVASGEYVGYVDSDDWIEPQMYEKLYSAAYDNSVDLVTSGYFLEGAYVTTHFDMVEAGIYRDNDMKHLRDNTIYRLDKKETGLRGSLWCKLFSRDLILRGQLKIPDGITIAEDKMCLLTCILECDTVAVVKEAYYHYMINDASMVHAANRNYLIAINEVYQYLIELFRHPNFTKMMHMQSELYVMELLLLGINSRLGFQTRNLLWFDPYWLDKIPSGSKVVLYGAGEAGRKCRQQLLSRNDLYFAGCVDFGYEHIQDEILPVKPPEALSALDYDYVVITIKNPAKAEQIRKQLEELGIVSEKILWFEQRELFWRYAEAEGLLNSSEREA